ncbi:hypothetical protein DB346_09395 [Verrucomicrobia bacterium LW23]|nr:hypothetical protein DB346_09395 [Verrucomicrobia bacterium LW23]
MNSPVYRRRTRGAAIVIVLACLVLMTTLLLAMLATLKSDAQSSSLYASGVSSRSLADSALNLVMGEIREASSQANTAWISQPGLLRTFDTRGNAVKAYKLYSSSQMVVTGEYDPASVTGTDYPRAEWLTLPQVFADMNEPVRTADGFTIYPIVSPDAVTEVEGFSSSSSDLNFSMPVRWLYVLKDGTLAAAEPGSSSDEVRIPGAGKDNPPYGRIAFWTDDESTKVNINTASEGTFSEIPVACTYKSGFREKTGPPAGYTPNPNEVVYEVDLAYYQPAQREYQRYPGHPASTSLSTVLWNPLARALGTTDRKQILEAICSLTPRYNGGANSSMGGTARPPLSGVLTGSARRFYASIDELLFTAPFSGSERTQSNIDRSERRRKTLDEVKFFLTANSNSPEQTLFNTPRVAIWPISSDPAKRTGFDSLIQFCSSVRGSDSTPRMYCLQRSNPHSPTMDWNLGRNRDIYAYLQKLTGRPIPGFTTDTFAGKYPGAERDQILTSIFDFIRTTNLVDVSSGTDANVYTQKNARESGLVVPLDPGNGTKGFGRYITLSELALASVAVKRNGAAPSYNYNLQFAIIPEFFNVTPGHPQMASHFRLEFSGLKSFRFGTQDLFANDTHTMKLDEFQAPSQAFARAEPFVRMGGHLGYRSLVTWDKLTDAGGNASTGMFPVGKVNNVAPAAGLTISGTVTLQLYYDPPSGAPVLVQRGTFTFPSTPFQVPTTTIETTNEPTGFLCNADVDYSRMQPNSLVQTNDWIRSLTPKKAFNSDYRLIAAVPATENLGAYFEKHPLWDLPDRLVHSLRPPIISPSQASTSPKKPTPGSRIGKLTDVATFDFITEWPDIVANDLAVANDKGVLNSLGKSGDWQNGPGLIPDGCYIGKVDEGEAPAKSGRADSAIPYLGHMYITDGSAAMEEQAGTYFSPSRLMASPVVFGSIPTGVKRGLPWQTLLFRPARAYLPGASDHPGGVNPPDHLLLDLFWMPVVEPYAISEPFSTAGKINLNYQIAPFSYLRRDTGLRAVFKSVMLTALNPMDTASSAGSKALAKLHKKGLYGDGLTSFYGGAADIVIRHPLQPGATLQFFEDRFSRNKPFISASEICTVPLVPRSAGASDTDTVSTLETRLAAFWQNRVKLTGDNSIELPYNSIYPRVTTRSNTYQVHVRAQQVKMQHVANDTFRLGSGRQEAEFRGSFVIERYLDPTSQTFNDTDASAILGPYKLRVISTRQLSY